MVIVGYCVLMHVSDFAQYVLIQLVFQLQLEI